MKSRWSKQCTPGAILVFREKRGDRYFDASTLEKAGAACRTILKERHGVYWKKGKIKLPEKPECTKQLAMELSGAIGELAKRRWTEYETACRELQRETDFSSAVELTLKQKDNECALDLVFRRRDYEYEGVELEQCSWPEEGV